jgi:hypothetical protein
MGAVAAAAIGTVLALMNALGIFAGTSWDTWRVVLKAIYALPLSASELETYQRLTGRTSAPLRPFREVWLLVGRRGGKSFITALIAVYQCTCRTFKLAPGETGVFMVIAADRKQARVIKGYVGAMLRALDALADMVENETAEQIELKNGLRIEITTASFRTLRGYTCIGAACDEVAFWQSDDSANPDTEILGALRPAMATQPDAILVCITSPHARRGEVWKAYQRHFGKDDSPVLVVQADSRTMNPELPQAIVDQAYADDPQHASAEYGAQFRSDLETFVAPEAVEACRIDGRFENPPMRGVSYRAFVDPSGGSSDSMTLAIGHVFAGRIVVDVLREERAPFDPDATVQEFAATLRAYRVSTVRGDRYGGEWPRERFQKHGISYRVVDKTKSELYQALLPRLNAATIELLDHDRAIKQLLGLERRTSRGGRDSVDHPSGGKDDLANAIAGVAYELRSGQHAIASITKADVESVRDELARCAIADAERLANGSQEEFLNQQGQTAIGSWQDRYYGRPKRPSWRPDVFSGGWISDQ